VKFEFASKFGDNSSMTRLLLFFLVTSLFNVASAGPFTIKKFIGGSVLSPKEKEYRFIATNTDSPVTCPSGFSLVASLKNGPLPTASESFAQKSQPVIGTGKWSHITSTLKTAPEWSYVASGLNIQLHISLVGANDAKNPIWIYLVFNGVQVASALVQRAETTAHFSVVAAYQKWAIGYCLED